MFELTNYLFLDVSTTPPGSPLPETVELHNNLREDSKKYQSDLSRIASMSPSEGNTPLSSAPSADIPDTKSILQVLASIAKNEPKNDDASLGVKQEDSDSTQSSQRHDFVEPSTSPSSGVQNNDFKAEPSDSIAQLLQLGQNASQDQQISSSSIVDAAASESNYRDPRFNRRRSRSPDFDSYGPNKRIRSGDSSDVHSGSANSYADDSIASEYDDDLEEDDKPVRARNVIRDPTIPNGSIKVLSRTLFIGGVTPHMSEQDLADKFEPYGKVQSVVIHKEGKHAFVKLYSRQEAEVSRERLEEENSQGRLSLRARWGVGFGPRECCDYATGISIIPMSKLTEADKRWAIEAEYGGTGDQPLESGMCIEEPDIEIGAGVSSKAISQRMPSNSSRNGPKSSRAERPSTSRPPPPSDHGRNFGERRGGRFSNSSRGGMHGGGHGEDRRARFDRSGKRNARNGRNDGPSGPGGPSGPSGPGGGRFGNAPHRDIRGLHNRRGNDRNNNNPGMVAPQGMMGFGGMGFGVPGMNNNMGGLNNMGNVNPMGNMLGGNGMNNIPANLASILTTLAHQGGAGGVPAIPNNNNGNPNHGHNNFGGKRGRGNRSYNNYGNHNNQGNINNNGNNGNDALSQLSQLTQQLAAAQQFGGGGGVPMNNMNPLMNNMNNMNSNMMGPGGSNPYGGPPNMTSDPRQRGGHNNNNNQGGNNNGGNSGLPFNMTPELAAMLLQQHQQQQNQQQRR